jgi:hypothetical protein
MGEPANVLWYGSSAVQLLFCVYLLWTGLAKRHPVFTAYLGCTVLASLPALYFMAKSADPRLPLSYTYFWLWAEPFLLVLAIAVAFEVHAGMWKAQASFVRQARPLLIFALLTAMLFAAIPIRAELSRFSAIRIETIMQFEFLAKRYISTVLAAFLLLSAALYMIVVRNSLKSELFRHEGMLAAYFGIVATAYFVADMGWKAKTLLNGFMASAFTVCFAIWISVLKPQNSAAGWAGNEPTLPPR